MPGYRQFWSSVSVVDASLSEFVERMMKVSISDN